MSSVATFVVLTCLSTTTASAQIPRFYTCNSNLFASAQAAFPGYGLSRLEFTRMNNRGDMIGYLHGSTMPPAGQNGRAFAYVSGQWYDLQLRAYGGLDVHDINAVGDVVGFYENTNRFAVCDSIVGCHQLALFLWREGQIFDMPNPVEPQRSFNAYFPAARINNIGQMIATHFDWVNERGNREDRDFAIEPISAGTWSMAPYGSSIVGINNLQEVLGYNSFGAWLANSPLAVSMPIVRIVDPPRGLDGGTATPVLLTDGGNILWITGGALTVLTGRDGTPAAQLPFQVIDPVLFRAPRAGGSDTLLLPTTPQGMVLWRWRTGESINASDMSVYDGRFVRPLDPADINAHDELLDPGLGICTPSAPIFLQHPTNVDAILGAGAILKAMVAGAMSLQWQKDGVPILNATNALLSFSAVGPTNAGAYRLVAKNVTGTTTSEMARLRIVGPRLDPSAIAYQPGSALQMSLPVPIGIRVIVEASSNLENWETVTNGVAEGSVFTVTDTAAATAPRRFYRVQFALP